MRSVFITLTLLMFVSKLCFGQESKFGKEWPPLKKCLEFSEETGVWHEYGSRTKNDYLLAFFKTGDFVVKWSEVSEEVNRFGRKTRKQKNIELSGSWELEHRVMTKEEWQLVAISSRQRRMPVPNTKVHFLTMKYAKYSEALFQNGFEKDAKSERLVGYEKIALWEFQRAGERLKLSKPSRLLWAHLYRSRGLKETAYTNPGGLPDGRGHLSYRPWTTSLRDPDR